MQTAISSVLTFVNNLIIGLFVLLSVTPSPDGDIDIDTVAEGASSSGRIGFQQNSFQLILIILVFVVIFYVLYLVYKYFVPGGRRGFGFGRSKHIKVLEITSVGPGLTIQLVKVSEEYFLIGVTKNQISSIAKLDADSLNTVMEQTDEEIVKKPSFKEILGKLGKKQKEEPSENENE
jgi:flagellar biosynthetic protein FliO